MGELVQIAAHTDPEASMLRLTFPDGQIVEDEVEVGDHIETPIHGRTGVGHVVIGPWAEALSAFCGREITLVRCERPGGTRRAIRPASCPTGRSPSSPGRRGLDGVDARRFRMLIELEGATPHEEDTWIGHRVEIGGAVVRRDEARRPVRDHDAGPRHGRPGPRHAPDADRLPRLARRQACRLRRPRRCSATGDDSARRQGAAARLTVRSVSVRPA